MSGKTTAEYKHRWYMANRDKCAAKGKERYLANKEHISTVKRQWYLKNIDRLKIKDKEYRERNRQKRQEQAKNYKKLNWDRVSKKQHEWYLKNHSKLIARVREWREQHPDKVREGAKRRCEELMDGYVRAKLKRLGYTDIGEKEIEAAKFIYRLNKIRRELCQRDQNLKRYWKMERLRRLER